MRRLLIFGAGGFVGRYLAAEFHACGYTVFGSDLAPVVADDVQSLPCDLLDPAAVAEAFSVAKPTHVINLAAISSVKQSWEMPQKTVDVNVVGALNLLEGARRCTPVPKVLMIGSSEEYAISNDPIQEDYRLDANNPYGLSKVMQERFLSLYRMRFQMPVYHVRAFNHTGVGQSPSFVLPSWCKQAAELSASGKPGVMRVGNLDVKRDFCDVRDIVKAYRMIIESDDCETVYHVGSGMAHSLRELLDFIVSLSAQPIDVQIDPLLLRPVDNPTICCDHSLITTRLGWQPAHSIFETLREMFEYWGRQKP